MIKTTPVETLEQFQSIKPGDIVVCEWKCDMYCGSKETRLGTYTVVENKERCTEIILQKKMNVYFNYAMFLMPQIHGVSNLKSIILITVDISEE